MRKMLPLALLAAVVPLAPSAAVALPAHSSAQAGQWCPGQPWELEWGVNWDRQHCHGTVNPQGNDTDLDGDAPSEYGAPPKVEQEAD